MAQNGLDDAQVHARFQQVSRHTVAQTVYVRGFLDAALFEGAAEGPLQGAAGDGADVLLHAVSQSVRVIAGNSQVGE